MSIEGLKMCKIQSLRLSVNEQLTLVGDEIWSVMEKHQQHPGGGGPGPAGGQGPGGGGGAGALLLGPPGGSGTTGVGGGGGGGVEAATVSVRLFVSERLSAAAETIVALVQREMDVYEAQLLDIVVNKPHHSNKMHNLQFQLPPYGGSDQSLPLHQNHGGAVPPGGDALSSSCSVGQSNDSDGQGGGALAKRTYKRTRGRGQRPNHSCLLCKKAFRHKTNLVKHAADTHMDNAGCVCGVCGDTPDGREALAEHMESHRSDGSGAGGTCSICGKSFQNMETHMRRHTGVKPYSCPVCYKRFPRPGALRRHKKIHARDPRVCYVCGEMFRGEEELQAHIKDTHKGEDHCEDDDDEEEDGSGWKDGAETTSDHEREPGIGNYYCRVCGDTFYSKGFLRKHALSHCKEAQCACGVCGEWFESGEGLTTHLRSHREPSGPCKICGKVFQNMETHMRRHTGEKPYSCSICHKRFPRPGALRRHKKTHVAERAAHASTSQANKAYGKKSHMGGGGAGGGGGGGHPSWGGDDRDDLDKDGDGGDSVLKMLEQQAEMDKVGGAPDPDDLDLLCPPHRCMVCGDNFQSKGHLRKHAERHFNDPESRCGVCGERVPAHESLTEHLRSHIETGGKICHVCGKTYQNIDTHMRIHTGVKPYTCPVCNKSFPRPGALRRHRKLHTGERPYICEFCGKAFIDNGALSTHLKSHTDDKLNARVSCDVCGKSLASAHVLEVHKRIHTGEKPFECHVCGKAFRQVGGLNAHMLTHTGEKPFSCGICSKSFSTKGYLETHVRFHKKDKPFGCHLCWKAFVTKNDLKKHLLTHSGEKPYSCRVCGKSYQEKRSRDVHMKVHLGGTGVKPGGKDGGVGVGVGVGVLGVGGLPTMVAGGMPDLRRHDGGVGGPMGMPDLMRRHEGLALHRDFIQL